MTHAVDDKLSVKEAPRPLGMQQLLAAVGAKPGGDARQDIEAFDIDWRQPRYFSRSQLKGLNNFAENVSAAASVKFTHFYQRDFHVTTDSTSQHFADEFLSASGQDARQEQDKENPDYYLAFGAAQTQTSAETQPWGVVGIPHETALAWTTQSLGDTNSGAKPPHQGTEEPGEDKDTGINLSQLEISLLLDIASLLVEALSDSYGDQNLNVVGGIVTGRFPLELESTKDLCKITFNTKKADAQDANAKAFLLMLCDKLEPVTKKNTETAVTLSAEDASKAILRCLHQTPIPVTVHLGSAAVALGDLMNLAVNDILVLDMKVNEPAKLIVNGLVFLHGRLAKAAGNYAMAITSSDIPHGQEPTSV